ncbi:MFS transporter [Gordonia jinghuaiqii]|uniref:MFS transporter n=1 Tax=Gordonia jinghuaiqii TaxID=2758710 RepID=A0A7D7QHP3_9ACTN|nr:MFS transporter [Gordonia jinghuaiqii]MCR5978031.1 MFS transporter [Gordonia jinghuaiqii]QMT01504.1 MFS transporter [Gordonia jinghuaiqii]
MATNTTAATVAASPPSPRRVDFSRVSRRAWVVTGMLVLFQIIAFADKAVLGLVSADAMAELGLTAAEFGFIGSAFFFLYAIVSVITGFLASKFSVKWILFAMGITWAVLQFPMLLGGGAAILLLTRIVLGGAEGPATAMSLTSTQTWFSPTRRALPSNLVAAGSTLGPVFAAPLLAWVIAVWGWRWAFGVLGIIGLVWVIAWWAIGADGPYRDRRGQSTQVADGSGPDEASGGEDGATPAASTAAVDEQKPVVIWRALLSVAFLAAVIGGASNFWVQGFLTTWLPQYLGTVVGLDLGQVGMMTTVPWVVGALVLLGLGAIGQRLLRNGRTAHIAIAVPFGCAAVLAGICFIAIRMASGPTAVVLLCVAAGCSLAYPMTASAIGYAVGARQRPIMMATLGGVASFGAVISPSLVGWLMTKAGYVTPPKGEKPTAEMAERMADGVHQAFTITGILLLVGGALCIAFLRPERLGATLQKRYVKESPATENPGKDTPDEVPAV